MSDRKQAKRILVVANETVGGAALIDAVRAKAEAAVADLQPFKVTVICPQNRPRRGYVIYDASARTAAENRLSTTLAQLRAVGVMAEGEVMDPDPYSATMDALGHHGADEIVISTFPETRSGWMRRDLIDRVRHASGLPVEHVVVDMEGDGATRCLVVANQTVGGEPLIRALTAKADESPHTFTVICPLGESDDGHAAERLEATIQRLTAEGLEAVGQVMDPDPFTAISNAVQFYPVDEIVISTLPATRSGWLRGDLIQRVRDSTGKPVEHVVVDVKEGATI